MAAPRLSPETIAAARQLNGAAIAEIYDVLAEPVHRFISLRIGGSHDAEDLTDQVFLKMIEALPRYDERGIPFAAWLFRIARNLIVDRHRRTARVGESVELGDSLPARGYGADPFDEASRSLDRDQLRTALATLTEDQREVIVLRFVEGWDVEEVASAMGRRPGAVHALQHRGLGALNRALSRVGGMA